MPERWTIGNILQREYEYWGEFEHEHEDQYTDEYEA